MNEKNDKVFADVVGWRCVERKRSMVRENFTPSKVATGSKYLALTEISRAVTRLRTSYAHPIGGRWFRSGMRTAVLGGSM